ncbi:MAG: hypothetical protein ABWZ52_05780 [Acidimicrobiales bacterium]
MWGGSGGSYQTTGAIENTTGVWDGAVPFVIAAPTSIPNNYAVRALASLVLKEKLPAIADAVAPGGHDPLDPLDEVERAVFDEATKLGLPVRAWENHEELGTFHLLMLSHLQIGDENAAEALAALEVGGELRFDNRWYLALHFYHRHQVPTEPGFYAWDQFRARDGTPTLPQRKVEVGPIVATNVCGGGTQTGAITGKVIAVASLVDADAFPWQADWYRSRVQQSLSNELDDHVRLWYTDNADHFEEPLEGPRRKLYVSYVPVLQQALRDLSAWVERGVRPPASTRYEIVDSTVVVPARALARRGVQPTVSLLADGLERVEVGVGEPVRFTAAVAVPPETGSIVDVQWELEGLGTAPSCADLSPIGPHPVHLATTHAPTPTPAPTWRPRGSARRARVIPTHPMPASRTSPVYGWSSTRAPRSEERTHDHADAPHPAAAAPRVARGDAPRDGCPRP